MRCSRCQHENPDDHSFCGQCGSPLTLICASCGFGNPTGQRFCGRCGAGLGSPIGKPTFASPQSYTPSHLARRILESKAAVEGERKQVSVLFADLKGSMELLAERDPEEARALLEPVIERMMEAVHHYDGTVNQVMGDAYGVVRRTARTGGSRGASQLRSPAHAGFHPPLRRRCSPRTAFRSRSDALTWGSSVGGIGSETAHGIHGGGQTTHLPRMSRWRCRASADDGSHIGPRRYVSVGPRGRVPVSGPASRSSVRTHRRWCSTDPQRLRAGYRSAGATPRSITNRALESAGAGHGQIVAVVGEPGVGKSRRSTSLPPHRLRDWSVGRAPSPTVKRPATCPLSICSSYCRINDRDTHRDIRKGGGKPSSSMSRPPPLPPSPSLLDVPTQDDEWDRLDPPTAGSARSMPRACCCARARCSLWCVCSRTCTDRH